MKIGIYDPYFHILGGAERYVLSIARCFAGPSEVTIFTKDTNLLGKAESKFGLDLKEIKESTWENDAKKRDAVLQTLDIFFYVTDGSIFSSTAKKNILIIQTPVHIPKKSISNWLKFRSWHHIICYSNFMADIIKGRLGKHASALFVPITSNPPPDFSIKENVILSVGRFFPQLHNKKQFEMVEMFEAMYRSGLTDVKLYLVGSVDPGGEEYYEKVQLKARSLPIWIESQLSNEALDSLYKKARVYWHATGYGEDLARFPERAEHFGVSTLEAMNHGAIPLIYPGGGQTEIVTHNKDGYHWRTQVELEKYTRAVFEDSHLQENLALAAFDASLDYQEEIFCKRLHEVIQN